ncbi:MAG: hypothetical protein WCS73_00955 [Lentisphaeria bacterium]
MSLVKQYNFESKYMHFLWYFLFVMIVMQMPFCNVNAFDSIDDQSNGHIFVKSIRRLGDVGYGVTNFCWSADGKQILLDKKNSSQSYDVMILDLEKLTAKCKDVLSPVSEKWDVMRMGEIYSSNSPVWRPDNKYLAFCGELGSNWGYHSNSIAFWEDCELCLADAKLERFWVIKPDYHNDKKCTGITMPFFSPDGKWLVWTAFFNDPYSDYFFGNRRLAVGNIHFYKKEKACLDSVRLLNFPGENDFIEFYGFSPDANLFYFSANLKRNKTSDFPWTGMDIFSLEYQKQGSEPIPLTDSPEVWDRYACVSSGGKKILWSSGKGFLQPMLTNKGVSWRKYLRTELWIMNSDGTDKKCLTEFNNSKSKEYLGGRCFVGRSAFAPNSKKIAVVVYTEGPKFKLESNLYILELETGYLPYRGVVIPTSDVHKVAEKEQKKD